MHRPPRVLIVDDDRDNREAYAEYLRFRGFEIDEADTGAKAVEQALRLNPDLVLLDMRLPDIDGAEVSRRLHTHAHRPRIIALSACVFSEDVEAALASGCDHFLAKPCLPETLEAELLRVLHGRASARLNRFMGSVVRGSRVRVQRFRSSRVLGFRSSGFSRTSEHEPLNLEPLNPNR